MKIKSRKQARKEFRKAKKIKKHEFFSKKKLKNKNILSDIKKVSEKNDKSLSKDVNKREFQNPHERQVYEREKEKKEKEKLEKAIQQKRKKQLKADNLKEDIKIKKLEKQLKMHKGKSKAFAIDGLDFLLDVCDKNISGNEFEKTLEDSDSEFENDLDDIMGKPKDILKKNKQPEKVEKIDSDEETFNSAEFEDEQEKEKDLSSFESNNDHSDQAKSSSEDELNQMHKIKKGAFEVTAKKVKFEDKIEVLGEDSSGHVITPVEDKEESKKTDVSKTWEDIYGRTRDDKGNVVQTYTPPHLRKKVEKDDLDEKNHEKLTRLKKQLKGLLNRLAESNMGFISNQIEELYMSNSRNNMNEILCCLFSESLVIEVLTPERLITEHAMLIAVLHSNVGSEVGAHFLQYGVTEFNKLLQNNPTVEDKRINNVLLFIMHLYNFQVFHSKLMYDIINELLKTLEEKQIELLLLTLRTVGFNLRKDNPVALKSLVLKVQEKANLVQTGENSSRVKFMLEMLMAIKNNNMSKIPNYNPEFVERLRKNLKALVRKGNYSTELNISFQDLLSAEKQGRWWIVGSAWFGPAPTTTDSNKPKSGEVSTEFSQKLLELARKQRMNTDVRRNIFCILMTAEDFLEAFEKLLKLKLKGAAEREIMNVLLHCALQEKNFNPYYVFLANKFCTFDRKYQMMLQCAIWDRIKEIKNAVPVQVTNLAKFIGNVILERGLPISILKVIQFSDLDKPTTKFMRQVLLTILFADDRNAVVSVFKRISDSSKLKFFRESLRLFLRHFVFKNTAKSVEEEKVSRLAERVQIAELVLTSTDSQIVF